MKESHTLSHCSMNITFKNDVKYGPVRVQWVLLHKPDVRGQASGSTTEGENRIPRPLTSTRTWWHVCTQTHMHMLVN